MLKLAKQTTVPARTYTTSINYNEENSSSADGSAPNAWTALSQSDFRYKLDASSRPVLIQDETKYIQPGSGFAQQTNKSYYGFYYGKDGFSVAGFSFSKDANDPSAPPKLVLNTIRSYAKNTTTQEIFAEDIILGQSPVTSTTNPYPSYGRITRIRDKTYTELSAGIRQDAFNAGGTISVAPTVETTNTLSFERSKPDIYQITEDYSLGDRISGSGTISYNNKEVSIKGSAAGDSSRLRSSDNTYLTKSDVSATLTPFSGSYNTLAQWLSNDMLLNCIPLPQNFTSYLVSALIGGDASAFRIKDHTNSATRSNSDYSTTKVSFNIDPVTGAIKGGQTNLSNRNTYNGKPQTSTQAINFNVSSTADRNAVPLLAATEADPLLAQLATAISQVKANTSRINLNGWSDSNGFLFSSII